MIWRRPSLHCLIWNRKVDGGHGDGQAGVCRRDTRTGQNLELFEFAPKVRTPAEYGRYMIQDSGHYEYDPNLEEFYDYERYGKLRMEKETGAFTEKDMWPTVAH